MQDLETQARETVRDEFPFMRDDELIEKLVKMMIRFHNSLSGETVVQPVKGRPLVGMLDEHMIHRADRKAFRAMLRHMYDQGQLSAWKEGRVWFVSKRDEQKLLDAWAAKQKGKVKRDDL